MMIKFKLDELMFKNGKMKVPQLVELSGLNRNTLYALEKGNVKRVDTETIDKLCKVFKCSVGDLLEYVADETDD